MRLELVRDWMSREVITISPKTTVLQAGEMMVERSIRRLPVVEDGKLVGIVTYGDVRGARAASATSFDVWELSLLLSRLTIGEIMTPNPVTVSPDDTIGRAAQLLLKYMIGGLPVIDRDGQLVGIITESDIFRLVVRDWMHSQDESGEPYTRYD
jgi:acetoin utilization protein AcuB